MENFRVFASCHNHSTFSDADVTPEHLARMAKCMGHGGIILTDHDTVKGYRRMKEACDKYGLLTMIGCEFGSAENMKSGLRKGCHLLGFDFDPEYPEMKKMLDDAASCTTDKVKILFEWGLERGSLRPGISWEDIIEDHPENDYISNNTIFDSYMKRGIYCFSEYDDLFFKPNFMFSLPFMKDAEKIVGRSTYDLSTRHAIDVIKRAGGVPVLAHPSAELPYTEEYIEMGVMGFETRHSMLTPEMHRYFEDICDRHGLYKMGGSDHENVLGGYLCFDDPAYMSDYEMSGIDEEAFMTIYERRLG